MNILWLLPHGYLTQLYRIGSKTEKKMTCIIICFFLFASFMKHNIYIYKYVNFAHISGMLLTGFLLRNIPCSSLRLADDIDPSWSATLRSMALVVILLQAGLGLDAAALRRLSLVCVRLCCLPCIAEAVTAAIAAHFILGFPWLWGLMLGWVTFMKKL